MTEQEQQQALKELEEFEQEPFDEIMYIQDLNDRYDDLMESVK